MSVYRILLADDHTLFRKGIKKLLCAEADIRVLGEATNGGEAVQKAVELRPDLVLIDVGMPGMSSFEAAALPHRANLDTSEDSKAPCTIGEARVRLRYVLDRQHRDNEHSANDDSHIQRVSCRRRQRLFLSPVVPCEWGYVPQMIDSTV
jgi:hypothetical protein